MYSAWAQVGDATISLLVTGPDGAAAQKLPPQPADWTPGLTNSLVSPQSGRHGQWSGKTDGLPVLSASQNWSGARQVLVQRPAAGPHRSHRLGIVELIGSVWPMRAPDPPATSKRRKCRHRPACWSEGDVGWVSAFFFALFLRCSSLFFEDRLARPVIALGRTDQVVPAGDLSRIFDQTSGGGRGYARRRHLGPACRCAGRAPLRPLRRSARRFFGCSIRIRASPASLLPRSPTASPVSASAAPVHGSFQSGESYPRTVMHAVALATEESCQQRYVHPARRCRRHYRNCPPIAASSMPSARSSRSARR